MSLGFAFRTSCGARFVFVGHPASSAALLLGWVPRPGRLWNWVKFSPTGFGLGPLFVYCGRVELS